jgi:peptide/nickel transport system permease protein
MAWPGLGQAMVRAAEARDYPVVQALLLLAVAVFITLQLLSDVVCAAIDPRVREQT